MTLLMTTLRSQFTADSTRTRFDVISRGVERLWDNKDIYGAIGVLQPYIDNIQEDTLFTREQKVKLLMTYTKLLCACNRFEDALPYSALTCSMSPDDFKSWTKHAYILKFLGQHDVAEIIYQQVLSQRPDDIMALTGLGNLYEMKNDVPSATAAYRKVLELQPDDRLATSRLRSLQQNRNPA